VEATATFFLVGSRIARHKEVVARIAAEGHEIGSHSWRHGGPARSRVTLLTEPFRTSAAIRGASGARPRWFRPPYARSTPALVRAARLAGMRTVTWDVDPRDWERDEVADIVEQVLRSTRAGSIVVFHEDRPPTVAAIASVVRNLKLMGLETVTVTQLLDGG
jgi:peptidoglycan/xylan/chitin deacetylase (PgdA/CDA1 family)